MSEPAYPLESPDLEGQDWPAQGQWTYEDYLRIPEDGRRYEVIRGTLYVSASPIYNHQFTLVQLLLKLGSYVQQNEFGIVLPAPFDIILPEGIATPVEPDILFIRKENQPRWGDKNFQGVPDLLVEVLSPSTHYYDRRIKLAAYRDAGVPEYWLVDPLSRTVAIHGWKDGSFAELKRGGEGDEVTSIVLPGFHLQVKSLFG